MSGWREGKPVVQGWYWMRANRETAIGHVYRDSCGAMVRWWSGYSQELDEARITHYLPVEIPPFPGSEEPK